MKVTQENIEQFEEEGYVVFRGALTQDDLRPAIEGYEDVVEEIAQRRYSEGKIKSLHENESFGTRLARIEDESSEEFNQLGSIDIGPTRRRGVFDFLRNENLVDLIEPFIGPEITCNAISHMRPKMPNTDVVFHQDAVFTTQDAQRILQLTVWVPLVAATEENGCMQVRPGIHKQRQVYWNYNETLPVTEPVTLPMDEGDVLFVHKLAPHGSGPNNTDAVRWSMDLRYQKTGEPSPRPEWPSMIVRSRRDPSTEPQYEPWCEAWAAALEENPTQIRYERPPKPRAYEGEMWLNEPAGR